MNKTYKYTLSSGEKKEVTFDVGVYQLAISNANGEDGAGVVYTAGENIQISEENVISATDTTYTAGSGIEITEQNVINNTAEGNTDIIAEQYDNEKAYAVGDYCIYDNKLYRCISAISPPYWYKIPKRFSSGMNFTNTSANPQDCYVTVQSNGHWIMASAYQNQTINIAQFSFYDFALNTEYNGTESVGYYNGYDYYNASLIAEFFPNGGYASESAALADLFSRPYFDTTKWEEVTVTDVIKVLGIYSLEEKNTGVKWIDGKDIYTKTIIIDSSNLNYGTENNVAHSIPNIETPVNFDGLFRFKSTQKSRIVNLYLVPEYYNQVARLSAAWGCAVFGFDTDNIVYYMGNSCLPDIDCLIVRCFYTKVTI